MKILYVLPFWPYLYTPWLFREMQWLRERGNQLAVLSLGPPPGPAANLLEFNLAEVPVLEVGGQYASDVQLLADVTRAMFKPRSPLRLAEARKRAGLRQGLHEWATMKRVLAFVRKHQPDVIEAHWAAHSAIVAGQIKAATAIPFAVRFHGGDLYRNPSPNLQKIVDEADALCPVSEFLVRLLKGYRPLDDLPIVPEVELDDSKIRVCHHGLVADAIASQAAPQSEGAFEIGTIGRVDPVKRHSDLIEVVGRLKNRSAGLRLRIIGGGQLEPQLREQAARLGVADRVTITGPQSPRDVLRQRANLQVYAQVADLEGFGVATLEGASHGLPVIASRTGIHESLVDEGVNGSLFDVRDVEGLCTAFEKMLDTTPAQRTAMGEASLRIVRERFEFNRVMKRLQSILAATGAGQPLPD